MSSILKKFLGDPNAKVIKKLEEIASEVNKLEPEFEKKGDEEIAALTLKWKEEIAQFSSIEEKRAQLEQIRAQAFSAVREASKRTLGQRHYDAQIMGGYTLHEGNIAEMKTGEGKTLAATLPSYLNSLLGIGVHIVTVNDYLARRDTSWMGRIYNFLGLTTSCLQQQGKALIYDREARKDEEEEHAETHAFKVDMDFLRPVERREAYRADIIYGINSEFGFDYLRDNMVYEMSQKVQRGHYYAIIDEVDSILIDEARTPLIISQPDRKSADLYKKFARLVTMLAGAADFSVDEERHAVSLSDEGIAKMERLLGVPNIYTEDVTLAFHLDQSLKAQFLYKKDKDYMVKEGNVIIVDQFTGRLMHGRRYSQGLHQAIEAKEDVPVKEESHTLATITIQNYFRMYTKLSGMTGTAATEAEEFHKIYNLHVTQIPTNRSMIRADKRDVVYKNERGKFRSLVDSVKKKYERGQPVLIGTISIEKNELLSELLTKAGVPHNILNAKQHEREAETIAQAGRLKAVTLATNMAGRGVDIILGGNPPDHEVSKEVRLLGGLCVFGSERHEARRIDNQLRGRSGRQGDAGESQFFISLEDDLMRIFGGERVKNIMDRLGLPEDMPIENKMISKSIEKAQERVEGHNFDIRKHLVEYDDVINKQRATIYGRRNDILQAFERDEPLQPIILDMVRAEIEQALREFGNNMEELKRVLASIPIEITNYKLQVVNYEIDKERVAREIYELSKAQYDDYGSHLDSEAKKHIEKTLLLRTIDTLWVAHLDAIEHLRVGIGLRGYGQRDPLVEYKREAFSMYKALTREIERQVAGSIYKIFIAYQTNTRTPAPIIQSQEVLPKTGTKPGRNEQCWCGSGKKYKKCHGA